MWLDVALGLFGLALWRCDVMAWPCSAVLNVAVSNVAVRCDAVALLCFGVEVACYSRSGSATVDELELEVWRCGWKWNDVSSA